MLMRRHHVGFSAARELKFSELAFAHFIRRRAHRKESYLIAISRQAMKSGHQVFRFLIEALVDKRAGLAAGHRLVVMDEEVISLQRYAHKLDRMGEIHLCPLQSGGACRAGNRSYRAAAQS